MTMSGLADLFSECLASRVQTIFFGVSTPDLIAPWFSFRLFVRSLEISKTAHRIVLIFGTKLSLDNGKKVTFLFF